MPEPRPMRVWMDVVRRLEPVMADHERLFDTWEAGHVVDVLLRAQRGLASARSGIAAARPSTIIGPARRHKRGEAMKILVPLDRSEKDAAALSAAAKLARDTRGTRRPRCCSSTWSVPGPTRRPIRRRRHSNA